MKKIIGQKAALCSNLLLLVAAASVRGVSMQVRRQSAGDEIVCNLRGRQLSANVSVPENCNVVFLGGNSLSDVPKLSGRRSLLAVSLANNRLSGLPAETFRGSDNLEELWIASNLLTEAPALPESVQAAMKYLDLSRNQITEILGVYFSRFSSLVYIDLYANKLAILPDISHLQSTLQEFHAGANLFTFIPSEYFQNFSSLQVVVVSESFVSVLVEKTFADLPNLISVSFQFSRNLTAIETDVFARSPNISDLFFYSCSILRLPNLSATWPTGQSGRLNLDLRSNRIENISRETLLGYGGHVALAVDNNPIVCFCQTIRLLIDYSLTRHPGNPVCRTPAFMRPIPNNQLKMPYSCGPATTTTSRPKRPATTTTSRPKPGSVRGSGCSPSSPNSALALALALCLALNLAARRLR